MVYSSDNGGVDMNLQVSNYKGRKHLSIVRGYGYVFSQTVRGGSKELKQYVLDDKGYKWIGEDYKKNPVCIRVKSQLRIFMAKKRKYGLMKSRLLSTVGITT